jgi:hypothetical protein
MKAWFDDNSSLVAVDERLPVDYLEPEEASPERGLPAMITVVEAVARTFFTGDPKITLVSWRILLGEDWDSIRACARRAGCTAQAISRRLAILSRQLKKRPPKRHVQRLARWGQREQFQTIRREGFHPPAACEDQLRTNTQPARKGGRP